MTKIEKYFSMAKLASEAKDNETDKRKYKIGAIGIRSDGTIVKSRNIATRVPEPTAHAESRLSRKLTTNSTVFVVRVLSNGSLANARPCKNCLSILLAKHIKRCYYSINNNEYGVIENK
jgi:tRNA(Arg) A34 adenosine deaminase TadA